MASMQEAVPQQIGRVPEAGPRHGRPAERDFEGQRQIRSELTASEQAEALGAEMVPAPQNFAHQP